MKKIIFKLGSLEVRIYHCVLLILVAVLALFGLKGCEKVKEEKEIADNKVEKMEDICTVQNENVYDLNELFARADLCSEAWFKDYHDYMSRIEDQNKLLKNKSKESIDYKLYEYQEKLLQELKDFDKEQSVENIEKIEGTISDYMKLYSENC